MVSNHSLRALKACIKVDYRIIPIQWSKEEHFAATIVRPLHKKAPVARNNRFNDRFSP